MAISLAPDPAVDPLKPKPLPGAANIGLAPALPVAQTGASAPLPTEYPNAPSTTGTPQNRLQLATTAFDTFAKSTAPQYTADLREATQKAAGAGSLGSGQLRTTYGNLANQRALALDTSRANLINSATTATISDQQAADAQKLAGYNAETGRIGTMGNLSVAKDTLGLAKEHEATSSGQTQQQIDLAKKTADINAAFQAGTLTLAQKDQALRELSNQQGFGLEQEKLGLAKEGQTAGIDAQKAALALQEKLGLAGLSLEQQKVAIAQKQQEIEQAYQAKQIGLAERNAALAELSQAQQNALQTGSLDLAKKAQSDTQGNEAAKIGLAKQQLEQAGTQFGLSLAQQKELATMADKTQNKQIDVSTAQGKASLALELARIMGAKDPSQIDPNFIAAIAKALGFGSPGAAGTPPSTPDTSPGTFGLSPDHAGALQNAFSKILGTAPTKEQMAEFAPYVATMSWDEIDAEIKRRYGQPGTQGSTGVGLEGNGTRGG